MIMPLAATLVVVGAAAALGCMAALTVAPAMAQVAVYEGDVDLTGDPPPLFQSTGNVTAEIAEMRRVLRLGRMSPVRDLGERDFFRQLGRPVGRLFMEVEGQQKVACTASLIADDLILTNNHCIAANPNGRVTKAFLRMGFLVRGEPRDQHVFYEVTVAPEENDAALDYAIHRVAGDPGKRWGTVALAPEAELGDSQSLFVIHHPLGFPQYVSRACLSARPALQGAELRHQCDTFEGSSGSPVFDLGERKVVALHYGAPEVGIVKGAKRLDAIAERSEMLKRLDGSAQGTRRSNGWLSGLYRRNRRDAPAGDDPTSADWAAVRGTSSCAMLDAFLSNHGQSRYAKFAKARRSELNCGARVVARNADVNEDAPPRAQDRQPVLQGRELVIAVQEELNRHECDAGKTDGVWGTKGRLALTAFAKSVDQTAASDAPSQALLTQLRGVTDPACKPTDPECDGIVVALASGGTTCMKPGSGESFKDCPKCPEMVVVPAGSFMMGSDAEEEGRYDDEGPQRRVTIARPFAVGRFEVTWDDWEACVANGRCEHEPDDSGWGRSRRPVINVSWDDAQAYVRWLSGKTGQSYRLLSEAEWEYAARAGTSTAYFWGNTFDTSRANNRYKTVEVGRYGANAWGLHDVHGNVWEWVADCYASYATGAPTDGSARTTGLCSYRVLRGGSWYLNPQLLRSAFRLRGRPGNRNYDNGFRVARTLNP